MRSMIRRNYLRKLCDTPNRAYYWVCILIKDIDRRLPFELQQCSLSSYQGDMHDCRYTIHTPYRLKTWRTTNQPTASDGTQ